MAIGFNADHGKKIDNLNVGLGQVSSQLEQNVQEINSVKLAYAKKTDVEKVGLKIESIVNNQIPNEYLEASVNNYIANNNGGLATKVDVNSVNENLYSISDLQLNNGFDINNSESEKYYNNQGVLSTTTGWVASLSYAKILPNTLYYAKSIYNANLTITVVWYTNSKQVIKVESNSIFTSPINAYYVRVSCTTSYKDVLVFGSSTSVNKYNNFGWSYSIKDSTTIKRIDTEVDRIKNKSKINSDSIEMYTNTTLVNGFNKVVSKDNFYINNIGVISGSAGWCVVEILVQIKPNTRYYAKSYNLNMNSNVKVAWYDISKKFISRDENIDFISPNNACFAMLCCTMAIKETFVFTDTDTSTYVPFGYKKAIKDDVQIPNNIKVSSVNGKTGDVVLTSADIGINQQDISNAVNEYLSNNSLVSPKLQFSQVAHRGGIKNYYNEGSDFVTFKSIYPVYDASFNTTGVVYALAEHLVGALTQGIFKSLNGGETWSKMGDLIIDQANKIWYEAIFVEPFQETIYLQKATNGYDTPKRNFLDSYSPTLTKIGSLDIGIASMLSSTHNIDACISKDFSKRIVLFGDYSLSDATNVYLWKTVDKGLTWKKVMTKRADNGVVGSGEIRHFHGVNVDPYTKDWWVCSGDGDSQCFIWKSTDDGENWTELFSGSQQERTLQFIFEKDCIYYAMDATTAGIDPFTKIFKINRSDMRRVEIGDVYKNFAVYNITKTFMPEGFLVWSCNEGKASVDSDRVVVQFYDYNTETLSNVSDYFFGDVAKTSYRGFKSASRVQDMQSGNIFVMPSIEIGQNKFGGMSLVSRYLKVKITN